MTALIIVVAVVLTFEVCCLVDVARAKEVRRLNPQTGALPACKPSNGGASPPLPGKKVKPSGLQPSPPAPGVAAQLRTYRHSETVGAKVGCRSARSRWQQVGTIYSAISTNDDMIPQADSGA